MGSLAKTINTAHNRNAANDMNSKNITQIYNSSYSSVTDSVYNQVVDSFAAGLVYQASKDYDSIQGKNGWYYVEKTSSGYSNMTWDTTENLWRGSNAACMILGGGVQHPDVSDSVRKWVAPYSGTLLVSANGNLRKGDTTGGDGVNVRLLKNDTMLWEAYITATDGIGISFPDRIVEVNAGDALYFELNKNVNHYCDTTVWDPIIEYKDPYVRYDYDANGRLVYIYKCGLPIIKIFYDNNGNLLRKEINP